MHKPERVHFRWQTRNLSRCKCTKGDSARESLRSEPPQNRREEACRLRDLQTRLTAAEARSRRFRHTACRKRRKAGNQRKREVRKTAEAREESEHESPEKLTRFDGRTRVELVLSLSLDLLLLRLLFFVLALHIRKLVLLLFDNVCRRVVRLSVHLSLGLVPRQWRLRR